jgi:ParB family chromosome partitioning protein
MIKTIPLTKLIPSRRNVRRSTDEQADLQLRADIEARGLLQNLVVAPAKKPRAAFTVEAGGRRLRALKSLVEDNKLDPAHEVPCLVIGGGAVAQEASLAENFQRLSMNPADECLAFGQLIEEGADVEGIARRFGLTVRFVEGRLRLATLAPVVFEALGAGQITLDVAKAYAATPDKERQAFVFEQVANSYLADSPDSIRRMMTQATVSAGDRRARLVGEEAYVAAGGRIERDLFTDEDGTRWLDIALLERLATEKLEAIASEMAASTGLAFVWPTLEMWPGHDLTEGLQRVRLETAPLTDEEEAEVEAARADIDELVPVLEDEEASDEERSQAEEAIRVLEKRIEALADKPAIIPDDLKPRLGTFLLLDDEGRPRLDSTYYAEPAREELKPGEEGQSGAVIAVAPNVTAEEASKPAGLSQALVDELAIQRRDILAVHVAANPGLALDLATFLMVDRGGGRDFTRVGSSLIAMPPANPVIGFKTPDAAATIARSQAEEALNRSWMAGETRAARFDLFRALPEVARAAWLGHAVARTLEASLNHSGSRACAFHDHLGRLLDIDVAKWWRPTGANYFDRVPKSVTLAALADVGGSLVAGSYAKAKKAELSESAERIFAGSVAPADIKDRALAWVPEVMRFAPPPAAIEDETPPWEDEPAKRQESDPGDAALSDQPQESGGGGEKSPQVELDERDGAA